MPEGRAANPVCRLALHRWRDTAAEERRVCVARHSAAPLCGTPLVSMSVALVWRRPMGGESGARVRRGAGPKQARQVLRVVWTAANGREDVLGSGARLRGQPHLTPQLANRTGPPSRSTFGAHRGSHPWAANCTPCFGTKSTMHPPAPLFDARRPETDQLADSVARTRAGTPIPGPSVSAKDFPRASSGVQCFRRARLARWRGTAAAGLMPGKHYPFPEVRGAGRRMPEPAGSYSARAARRPFSAAFLRLPSLPSQNRVLRESCGFLPPSNGRMLSSA